MRISGIIEESVVDGPGLRFVLFTQGCPHGCKNCHNPETWSLEGGEEISVKQIIRQIRKQKKNIRGITFSGGEPFLWAKDLTEISKAAKEIGWDIVIYSGFTLEELINMDNVDILELLKLADFLIDGPFIEEEKDIRLTFRGSRNQRVIILKETLESKKIVLWKEKKVK